MSAARWILAMLATWVPLQADAACAADPGAALRDALARAEQAFAGDDAQAFRTTVDEAAAWLGCQEEVVEPSLAAWYHRVRAMLAYAEAAPELSEEERLAIQHITAAACAADPAGRYAPTAVEPDEDLAKWLTIDLACKAVQAPAVPALPHGAVWLDGQQADELSAPDAAVLLEWPVVYQQISATGAVESTLWLPAGSALPTTPKPEPTPRSGAHVLMAVGGVAMATGAVLLGVAQPAVASICEEDWDGCAALKRGVARQYTGAGAATLSVGAAMLAGGGVWLGVGRGGAQVGLTMRLP